MHLLLGDKILPAEDARVSPLDRGFLYGDGAFSTLRAYSGRLAHYPEHWERITSNLGALGIEMPAKKDALLQNLAALLEKNNLQKTDAFVRVQISRGAGKDLAAGIYAKMSPTLVALAWEVPKSVREKREKGVALRTVAGLHSGGTAKIKLSNYAKNLLCTKTAREQGADDGVFIDGRGYVAEAASANLFFVKDGALFTPALDVGALPGITRERLLTLCRRESLPIEEGHYTAEAVGRGDEVFLTSSVSEIVPVTKFDDWTPADAEARPLTRRLQAFYDLDTKASLLP